MPLPNFNPNGYQVTEQLQENHQGGRIAYKAIEIATQKPVVIKQFRFATASNWDGYKEIEREIEVLKGLNHAGIPKYLEQFDPGDGLCLVQEYKDAQPLSKYLEQEYKDAQPLSRNRSFSAEEIKSIASQLLEILVYLQEERIPQVFHRDIKPENVLVDDDIKVYLIDFGLARIGNNTMAISTMMGGTTGFMPPEQLHNRELTKASDLYGLGATLICLITKTKSADIGNLVNLSTNKITFRDRVPTFSLRFIQWLEKMVEPDPANRYQNAKLALEALKPLDLIRIPEVNLDKLELNFVANSIDEKVSQTIRVTNTTPDTILQGKWSVSPHSSDPPHNPDSHSWISFSPQEFEGNQVDCVVKVDASKLKADKKYEREIVLNSNAIQEKYYLKVKVKTAPIKIETKVETISYWSVFVVFTVVALVSSLLPQFVQFVEFMVEFMSGIYKPQDAFFLILFGLIVIAILIFNLFCKQDDDFGYRFSGSTFLGIIIGIILCIVFAIWTITTQHSYHSIIELILDLVLRIFVGGIIGGIIGGIMGSIAFLLILLILLIIIPVFMFQGFIGNGSVTLLTASVTLLTLATGILTGVGAVIGFNTYLLAGLTASALPLSGMLIYLPLKLRRLQAQDHRQESQNLIEP